ncbi:MAG: DUF423 domain-containing protein [Saprospiraceae bacterium]|jgi:uncharacterized membrane protein YgdD (TMEM256/DUF423 family)
MRKISLRLSAIFGALAVALGAFGSHLLKAHLDAEAYATYETGIKYHFFHALTLLGISALAHFGRKKMLVYAVWLFSAGIPVFSGSIYLLAIDELFGADLSWLGPVTPLGGVLLIAGWACLFVSTFSHFDRSYRGEEN